MAKRNTKDRDRDAERSERDDSAEDALASESTPGDSSEGAAAEELADGEVAIDRNEADDAEEGAAGATTMGSARYVHAAFFAAGILAAYLAGKVLLTAWNALADWPEAVRQVPQLIEYAEDERATITMLVGAVLGAVGVLSYYRKESVRNWAGEVASELSRVTWPNRETVTNGTMVVLVASLVATVYVALLDRFWGYLTNLVYGA
jgi:preprotein translocase subunit SecE